MKKYLLYLLLLCLSFFAFAQKQTNIWYYGVNAGIDFNSGSPVPLFNGAVSTAEGCAGICDSNGNLLFYTSGKTVYNKNNAVMPNGNGLNGGYSASQSSLIAPMPGSDSLFYLFTIEEQAGPNGLQYSIIDMSLQGGLGDVITKNVQLVTPVSEKITGVNKTGSNNIWIVTHEYYTANFYSYLLTDTGLNTIPVITTVGSVHSGSGTDNAIGYMKISPTANKLALALSRSNSFELFDFDAATGIPSNSLVLPSTQYTYGIEFSKSGSILYASHFANKIYQYDLSGSNAAILASKKLIAQPTASEIGSLQMASDGKIYVVKNSSPILGCIQNPEILGTGCNYNDNAFSTSPKTGIEGLPNFLVVFSFGQLPVPGLAVSDTSFCANNCVDFTDQSSGNPTSWQWNFPGGNPSSSTLQNPNNICYNTSGTYDVTLIVTNSAGSDTIVMSNFITVNTAPTANISQSSDTLYSSAGNSYQWYTGGNPINGATDDFYVPSTEDFYSVVITDANGCTAADTIFFSLSPQTSFAASDTTICQKFCMDFFDQSGNNPTTWQWSFPGGVPSSSNQQNPTQICYNNPGVYDVTLITTNSFGSDTLVLTGYITVYSTPAFPTITVTGDILTSSYASSYQWQFNSVDIPGATNQSYTATQTGYYTVIITDENGCVSSTTVYVEVTGIDENENGLEVLIYEDPVHSTINIEITGKNLTSLNLRVVNSLGQVVFATNGNRISSIFIKSIDISKWSAGIYLVSVESGNFSVVKKIVCTR